MRAKERGCFVWKLLQLLLCQTLIYVASGQDVCRDPSSDDERAVMLNQPVCYICPRGTSNIEWSFDGAPVSSADGLTAYSNGSLFIDSVLEKFIGPIFVCRITGAIQRTTFSLSIASISPPTVSNETLNETDNLSIRCRANANPFPHTQVWLRNGQVVSTNSLLEIPNIQRAQAGLYTCNTTNTVGSAASTITVTVQYAPSNDLTVTSPVPWMSNTSLTCSFDGVPTPTITWKVNGTETGSGNDNYIIRTLDSTSYLDIIGTELKNTGQYSCEATNLLRTSSDQEEFIVQDYPPNPGVAPGFESLTDTSVTILIPELTGTITHFVVQYRLERVSWASTQQVTVPATMRSVSITNLAPSSPYQVSFHSVNNVGQSESSPVLSFTTGPSLEIRMIPEDDFVQGAMIVLTCALSGGNANPDSVTWLKDNQPVDQLNLQSVVITAHTLTISSATEEHSGVYVCRYTVNDAVVTSEVVIDIQDTPVPDVNSPHGSQDVVVIATSASAGAVVLVVGLLVVAVTIGLVVKCAHTSASANRKEDMYCIYNSRLHSGQEQLESNRLAEDPQYETINTPDHVYYTVESEEIKMISNPAYEASIPPDHQYVNTKVSSEELGSSKEAEGKPKTRENLHDLPNFFSGCHFLLYGNFEPTEKRQLTRYIMAYDGHIENYMGGSVSHVVSNEKWDSNFDDALKENASLLFISPGWVFACHNKQKLISPSNFRIAR